MSSIRPECVIAKEDAPCPRGLTAYLCIYNCVKGQTYGLIHGRLNDRSGHHCAIGSYFSTVNKGSALPSEIIDEVATVNDSCKFLTPKQRKLQVLRWLKWRIELFGYKFSGRKTRK